MFILLLTYLSFCTLRPRPVVPNLWYAYPLGYAAVWLGVRDGPVWGYAEIILIMAGNTKKVLSFGLRGEIYVRVVTRPAHH
jgi:hypothetical protein